MSGVSQVENLQSLVEKCKPLGQTVLIEILKLRNARMKVIIVVPASTGLGGLYCLAPELAGWQAG